MKPIMHIDPEGPQGNIFYILGRATAELMKRDSQYKITAATMSRRVFNCHSYEEAIDVIQEYVTINWKEGGVPM